MSCWCATVMSSEAICTPIILSLSSLSQRAIFVQFWWKILSAKLSRMFEDSCLIVELEGVLMWCFLRSLGHSFGLLSGCFLYSSTLQFSCHSYYVEKLVSGVTRSYCAVLQREDSERCLPSHAHWVLSPFRMCLPGILTYGEYSVGLTTDLSPNGKLTLKICPIY